MKEKTNDKKEIYIEKIIEMLQKQSIENVIIAYGLLLGMQDCN